MPQRDHVTCLGVTQITCCYSCHFINSVHQAAYDRGVHIIRFTAPTSVNAKGFMDDVKPWIKAYFLNLATTYGSNFDSAPPVEKVKKCQLKKVRRVVLVRQNY